MAGEQRATEPSLHGYFAGITIGGLLAFGGVILWLTLLSWADRLPPPPMTKVNYMDEKLHFIREHPSIDPNLIVVGSSMALRQFDGEPFEKKLGRGKVLNGASTLLKVHQTAFLTSFYMDHFPHLETIVLILGAPDFENCTTIPAELFNREDASHYAFEQASAGPLYLRYFAPAYYLARVRDYPQRRTPLMGDLWIDEYGSGPLQLPQEMISGLRYGTLGFDRACISSLHQTLENIRAKGLRPVVVFSPVHPEYRRQYPETGEHLREVANDIEPLVRPGIDFFDWKDGDFAPSDFFDAVHLQWAAVQRFSNELSGIMLSPKAAHHRAPAASKSLGNATTNLSGALESSVDP